MAKNSCDFDVRESTERIHDLPRKITTTLPFLVLACEPSLFRREEEAVRAAFRDTHSPSYHLSDIQDTPHHEENGSNSVRDPARYAQRCAARHDADEARRYLTCHGDNLF